MTANEILDTFSERIAADDRILSAQEKQLIASLLRHAKNSVNGCAEVVAETIARAVGEVVAERAHLVLGDRIVKRLLNNQAHVGGPGVTPPSPDPIRPQPPGPNPPGRVVTQAGSPPTTPPSPSDPMSPRPPGPNPPGISRKPETKREAIAVALAERPSSSELPEFLPANCLVLDEFLAPNELQALTQYTLQREMEFRISEVVSPGVQGGAVDYESRRSRVLMELGPHYDVIVNRLRAALPGVLTKLERPPFEITRVEAQITASNDGDYFRWHSDNGEDEIAGREITFVYFFHREPKPFRGGELRIYDSRLERGNYRPTQNYRAVVPEQNQAVLFVSSLTHEITPVEAPSRAFADSRFTVNGWFHK